MMFEPKIPRLFFRVETVQEQRDAVHKVNIERREMYTASVFSFLLSSVSLSEGKSYCLSK